MSSQSIESAGSPLAEWPSTIGEQRDALAVLAQLADTFADLPLPYVVVHTSSRNKVDLQLSTPDAFEQWRAALGVDSSTVTLHNFGGSQWLSADARYQGFTVDLCGFGVKLTKEQLNEPRELPADEEQPAEGRTLCGSVRDVLLCVLEADHEDRGGSRHRDVNGYEWPTAATSAARLRTVMSLSERGGQS